MPLPVITINNNVVKKKEQCRQRADGVNGLLKSGLVSEETEKDDDKLV